MFRDQTIGIDRDRKFVLYAVLLVFLTFVTGACGIIEGQDAQPARNLEEAPEAVLKARADLSEKLEVEESEILVEDWEEVEWANACLELGGEGEMCAQVITPGYEVDLAYKGEPYVAHTDQTGDLVRFE
jgi:hypothetical protein